MVTLSSNTGGRSTEIIEVTLSSDTAVLAPGDVVADTQVISDAFRANNSGGKLVSLEVIDEDDQKANLDIYFFTASVVLGVENAAPSITDANARTIQGKVSIAVADYNDLGGVSVARKDAINMSLESMAGTNDLAVAVVAGATTTPTYTAAGLKLRLGIEQD